MYNKMSMSMLSGKREFLFFVTMSPAVLKTHSAGTLRLLLCRRKAFLQPRSGGDTFPCAASTNQEDVLLHRQQGEAQTRNHETPGQLLRNCLAELNWIVEKMQGQLRNLRTDQLKLVLDVDLE